MSRPAGLLGLLGPLLVAGAALLFPACSSPRFPTAVPPNLNKDKVPHLSVGITAEHYQFTPEEVHVKAGTLLTLTLLSLDGTHGFKLADWDIDVLLEPEKPVVVELWAPTPGTYEFVCSHFCGFGHFGMNGTLVVDP